MRALVYTEERTLEVLDVPAQDVAAGRRRRCASRRPGICGSDVHGVATRSPRRTPPLIMGHELTGEVVAVGAAACPSRWSAAQVAVNPQVPCGVCAAPAARAARTSARTASWSAAPARAASASWCRCRLRLPARAARGRRPDARRAGRAAGHLRPRGRADRPGRRRDRPSCSAPGTIGVLMAQTLRLIGTELDRRQRRRRRPPRRRRLESPTSPCAPDRAGGGRRRARRRRRDRRRRGRARRRRGATRCGCCRTLGTALWLGMHDQDSAIPAFDLVVREQRVLGSFAYTNPEFARAVELLASGQLQPAVSSQRRLRSTRAPRRSRRCSAASPTGFLKSIVAPGAARVTPWR